MSANRICGSLGRRQALGALLLFAFWALPVIAQDDVPRRSLSLELDDVPGSTGYEIRVTKILGDGTKKPPVMFSLKNPQWSAKLVPGKYTMEVRSLDSRHVPGRWSAPQEFVVKLPVTELINPSDAFVIKTDEVKTDKVTFEWKALQGAEKYKFKILNVDGTLAQESVEKENTVKVSLPVGREYYWAVTAVMAGDIDGEVAAVPRKFELVGGQIDKPKFALIDDVNTTDFNWAQPQYATDYKFSLEVLGDNGEWKSFDSKDTKSNHRVYKNPIPSGKYRATVVARAEHRVDSEPVHYEFKTTFLNTRSPAAIEQVKSETSYETKSIFFGMASYFITSVNPTVSSFDNGSVFKVPSTNAIGGTGRLGIGTWFKEDSQFGVMAIGDLSGYSYQNNSAGQSGNLMYYSGTLEGVYRRRLGAIGQLRLTLGAQYRTLPVLVSDGSQNGATQSTLTTMGPLAGITVLHAFTHRIGAQVNYQLMDSMVGVTTPNGQSNQAALSYQVGLMGSLNLTQNLVGFLGYAYRDEVGVYATAAPSAYTPTSNRVEIIGNYLNLLLEYGF